MLTEKRKVAEKGGTALRRSAEDLNPLPAAAAACVTAMGGPSPRTGRRRSVPFVVGLDALPPPGASPDASPDVSRRLPPPSSSAPLPVVEPPSAAPPAAAEARSSAQARRRRRQSAVD